MPTTSSFLLFLPETILLVGALLAFIVSLVPGRYRHTWWISIVAALGSTGVAIYTLNRSGEPFSPGIYRIDLMSQLFKVGLGAGLFLIQLLAFEMQTVRPKARLDIPMFLMLATVGMMMLVSATELLTLYVSLEFSAYALYILVGLHRKSRIGGEAATKYVLFGAAASAVTLYGMSFVFGSTGTTNLSGITDAFAGGGSSLLIVGLFLFLAGLLFKLAVAPFHSWAPDVYQGGPNQIVAFIGTTSKLAAVAILARVCSLAAPSPQTLVEVFGVLAVLSMTIGNLAAIVQKDLKRLLAYSAVAHAGYLMLGYGTFSEAGLAAAIFYGFIYLPIVILIFIAVCAVAIRGSNPSIRDLRGLYHRSPALALVLLLGLFGLAGIPPTAGFAGKWFLFAAAIEQGHFYLVLFAAINATIALCYYLRVVKVAYLDPPDDLPEIPLPFPWKLAALIAGIAILWLGIYPKPLWTLAQRAAELLLQG